MNKKKQNIISCQSDIFLDVFGRFLKLGKRVTSGVSNDARVGNTV